MDKDVHRGDSLTETSPLRPDLGRKQRPLRSSKSGRVELKEVVEDR